MHWKPASVEPPPVPALKKKGGTFWHVIDSQKPNIDANKLVQLFETKHSKEQAIKVKIARLVKKNWRYVKN